MASLVKHVCGTCNHVLKIFNYKWDETKRCYSNEVKSIGYLCKCDTFLRKHYRKGENVLLSCKDHINCRKVQELHIRT